MKVIGVLAIVLLAISATAQTSNVTATITDPDGQTWNGGNVQVIFVPTPGVPGPFTWSGGSAFPVKISATMNGSGTFTAAIPDNAFITPAGSKWQFTLCSNTSAPCQNVVITVTGASPNLSTALSTPLIAPRFSAGQFAYGYADVEVSTPTPTGGSYFNVSSQTARQWSGTAWASVSVAGTVANVLPNSATTPLVAEYRMPASEVSTTTLTDSSGNGNNGTFPGGGNNPTRLATGGLGFAAASSQSITLPAADNACTSFAFGYSLTLPASNLYNSLMQAASFTASKAFSYGFYVTTPGSIVGDAHYYDIVTGIVGTGNSTQVENSGQGIHVIVFSGAVGQQDHIYVDGTEGLQYYTGPTTASAGRWTPGANWYLGGFNSGFTGFFNGNIYYAACWNAGLTAAQASQVTNVISNYMSQELQQPVPQIGATSTVAQGNGAASVIAVDGDSIFAGNDATAEGLLGWSSNVALAVAPVQIYVPAVTGTHLYTTIFGNVGSVDNLFNSQAPYNIYIQGGGRNDTGTSVTSAVEGSFAGACRQKRRLGWKCITSTILCDGGSANRLTINAYQRQHWAEFADGFVDMGGDPTLGIGNTTCSATGMVGGIHPSIWAGYGMMQYYLQRAINRITGPQDFTNAPTYASVSGAATATTNATDGAQVNTSGQSLATYTFTSNPFTAMGPLGTGVGVSVTCIGITPAGYNQTFITISSTATTVTGYIPTFGLGAQSVAGTCSAPASEDKYATLNVGAVNFPIGTACGYTGQRVYYRNINAGTTTITTTSMPNESAETITGAATIPQNTTAVFESVTTSVATTPQCGWIRISD